MKTYIFNNISLPLDAFEGDAFDEVRRRLRQYRILPSDATFRLYRRSVDARKREAVHFVFSVAVTGSFPKIPASELARLGMSEQREDAEPSFSPSARLSARPVVVGAGPAGLFCALRLAEAGYAPIILERGASVEERALAHERFCRTRVLDTESNIQFGAGGAGTFSDGKLVTRISDPAVNRILRAFVDFGAPREILWQAKPHVGTDILRTVVSRMCAHLVSLGAEIRYHTKVEQLVVKDGTVVALRTSCGDLPCGAVILAVGNSASELFRSMLSSSLVILPKPFSVGVRIEHLQADIDSALYGSFAGHPALGHAEYQLSHDTKGRGVYTFCMCPGGEVIAAASEKETVVVNGMSYHARGGVNANSAVAVSIFPEDYGATPLGAIQFRERLEREAYRVGGGDYTAPAIRLGSFLYGEPIRESGKVTPSYLGGAVRYASPETWLPPFITEALRGGLRAFDGRISGFADRDAVLTGVETRTSCAIRILRDERRHAIGTGNLYPCGEGAGYAGGITSSAADGYRTALALMSEYAPF